MGRPYQILYPLFSLFLVRVDLTDLSPVTLNVKILKVYDGDTVLVSHGHFQAKVRLARIDAPEKAQSFLNGKKGAGELSGRCLEKLLANKGVLEVYGHDMYGRILGDIDQVSFKLVEKGCVALYPYAKFNNQHEKYVYLRAYQKARREKVGLWAFGGVQQPKAWRKKNKNNFRMPNARRQ